LTHRLQLSGPRRDPVISAVFGVLALSAIVYVCLGLTPSSYGVVLAQIGAEEQGPILGVPRFVRMDEWELTTPLFQTAVRNGFIEVNETSFYREDLRTVFPVPLRNWSLLFRPQLWAFFLTGAPTAFSIYFAFLIYASLTGYTLLFRELGADGWLAVAASLIVFFSGFVQFCGLWSLAGFPWLLVILLKPLAWWWKALLFAWLMPATVLAHPYPPMLIDLALATLVLMLATRPGWFRSPREIAAVAIGGLATGTVVYGYFGKLLPIMGSTFYPGHRTVPPGTVPFPVVLSHIFPFLTLDLTGFRHLIGPNIVENATVGSFLLVLTLCLTRFRALWHNRPVRNAVIVLLSATAAMTLWQVAPVPRWIGRILFWDIADPQRLFCATGLLLTFACVLVWSNQLISPHWGRIVIFFVAGPSAALILKARLFAPGLSDCGQDLAICCLALMGCLAACYSQAERAAVLVSMVAIINVIEFGRFNPLQPAKPIFNLPRTAVLEQLRQQEAAAPDHILFDRNFFGATLNGMGFRSVNHILPTPQLAFFRKYFPTMNAEQFNFVFNRYAHIQISGDGVPYVQALDLIRVPMEVFKPIRDLRRVSFVGSQRDVCLAPENGTVEHIASQGAQITIEGWAPWKGESATQGICVLSSRPFRADPLVTVARPYVAEAMQNYAYVKAGFQLRLWSLDGRPIRPEEIALVASGTPQGDVRLGGLVCRSRATGYGRAVEK
jgi:hypothetical protein